MPEAMVGVDKIRLCGWYSSNEAINILFAFPPVLLWYFYFTPINQQVLFWPVAGLMWVFYWYLRRRIRRFCYQTTLEKSNSFLQSPKITEPTSEELLDSFDVEVLQRIDEARDEKRTDYINLMADLSDIIEPPELFNRLGKLRALSLVRTTPARVSLLPRGMDVLQAPATSHLSRVPTKYSTLLARARIDMENGNFNGVTDDVHVLFEEVLRDALQKELGRSMDIEWKKLQAAKVVTPDLNRAGLGHLLRAASRLGVIDPGSAYYMWLSSFLAVRNPQKHALGEDPGDGEGVVSGETSAEVAKTSLEIAEIFLRHWK